MLYEDLHKMTLNSAQLQDTSDSDFVKRTIILLLNFLRFKLWLCLPAVKFSK